MNESSSTAVPVCEMGSSTIQAVIAAVALCLAAAALVAGCGSDAESTSDEVRAADARWESTLRAALAD